MMPAKSIHTPPAKGVSARGNRWFVARLSGVAALGGLLFGFDTAVISGTIPYLRSVFQLSDYTLGWAVSVILIGCALGALFAGKAADRYGRRTILQICAIIFAFSGVGAGFASNLEIFILCRLIGGSGVGAAAMVSPMYIAETVPAASRGRLVGLYQLAILLGIMLAYGTNYALEGTGPNAWRWMFAVQAVPAFIFYILLARVPETPRWLIARGRIAAASEVLVRMLGIYEGRLALSAIQQQGSNDAVPVRELFLPAYRRVLWTGIGLAVFQQITGINAILYYAPVIFQQTGLDSHAALLQTIGIGVVNMASTIVAIIWVDRVGRRSFLLWGSVLMGLSLAGVAACFHWQYFDHYLVLICVLLYVAAFGGTLGAVTWVYLSEIFPNRVRGLALSAATLALWLADFAVAGSFPVMTSRWGTAVTLLVYAAVCGLAFLFFMYRVRETKGRTLEEIDTIFKS